MTTPTSFVLTGTTAAGKSAIAVELAERLGAEICSMDSMAVYRRMDIGTAKPTVAERARVPHHLVDLVDPSEPFDTALWLERAGAALADVTARGRRALFVGGTPLYLMGLRKGLFAGPRADPPLRSRLEAEEDASPGALHRRLSVVDPAAAARLHPNDRRRLVRALEVWSTTGAPITASQRQFDRPDRIPLRIIGVAAPRDEIPARIKERARRMFEAGLLAEVRAILATGGFSKSASQAIGYAECLRFLRGELPAAELVPAVEKATRQLVRKQETWFRRMPEIRWVERSADAALAACAD